METSKNELLTNEVAKIARCSISTVKRYADSGKITAVRDINGFRRFSLKEAKRLKEMLAHRYLDIPNR